MVVLGVDTDGARLGAGFGAGAGAGRDAGFGVDTGDGLDAGFGVLILLAEDICDVLVLAGVDGRMELLL